MTATAARTLPVVECFGPTVQGEGALAGVPTHFVRFGGCDFRCSWCDSMFAVDPHEVRKASRLTIDEIARDVFHRHGPRWVTLSGGNPALYDLGELVEVLHVEGMRVAVETQGTIWRDWLSTVDMLTISPKAPSSGMTVRQERRLPAFMAKAHWTYSALKIVVFDEADLDYARSVCERWPSFPRYLSCGTDRPEEGETPAQTLVKVGARYAWLCARVAGDEFWRDTRVYPQLHVLAWGHARGV